MKDFPFVDARGQNYQISPTEQFALDVLMGFSSQEKYLPSQYLYDEKGSQLFSEITETGDYYLTGCEFEIFKTYRSELARRLSMGGAFNLIELGAGDGRKTRLLLEEFQGKNLEFEYLPLDISKEALEQIFSSVLSDFSDLKATGLLADYRSGLKWVSENRKGANFVVFIGSSIGNFSSTAARGFLRALWNSLNKDDLVLIGFDLKKDVDVLLRAYNDSKGITREFNLNLLDRMNRELGAEFDRKKFQHFGTYNPQRGAMESHLISLDAQEVYIRDLEMRFRFRAFESIHLEYSYKYLISDIESLAGDTGFHIEENFFDSGRRFVDSLWRVKKH